MTSKFQGWAAVLLLSLSLSGLARGAAPVTAGGMTLFPVRQARILDTRTTSRLRPNEWRRVQVKGNGGAPLSGVDGAIIALTVVLPSAAGYLNVFHASPEPASSPINYRPGLIANNVTLVRLDSTGSFLVSNHGTAAVDVLVDLQGYLSRSLTGGSQLVVPPLESNVFPLNRFRAQDNLIFPMLATGGGPVPQLDAQLAIIRARTVGWVGPGSAGFGFVGLEGWHNFNQPASASVLNYSIGTSNRAQTVFLQLDDKALHVSNQSGADTNLELKLSAYTSPSAAKGAFFFAPHTRLYDSRSGNGFLGRTSFTVPISAGLVPLDVRTVALTVTSVRSSPDAQVFVSTGRMSMPSSGDALVASDFHLAPVSLSPDGQSLVIHGDAGGVSLPFSRSDAIFDLVGYFR